MDVVIRQKLADLNSEDGDVRYAALTYLMQASDQPVDWAYDVWDGLVQLAKTGNNHQRAIGTTLLANLAKSDPKQRILKDLDLIMTVTHDSMFVTARHTIQALWKIGAAGKPQQKAILERISERFAEAAKDKHPAMTRNDLQIGLGELYDATHDAAVRTQALALIDTETDEKAKKKYQAVWKKRK